MLCKWLGCYLSSVAHFFFFLSCHRGNSVTSFASFAMTVHKVMARIGLFSFFDFSTI